VIETLKHGDGTVHHSLVSKFPIPGAEGEAVLVGGMAIDITDRLAMEETVREADRRKGEFLATLAHELRNPLAPIRHAATLLAGQPSVVGEAGAEVEMIARQVAHLARLVDDLMDIARIERGKIELRRGPMDVAMMLQRAAEAARSSLEERGHRLSLTLPEQPLVVEADPTRLEQVVGNLLGNSIKYTEPGGEIALEAGRDEDQALIRVRDSGVGIPPEMLPRIFEPFVQVAGHAGRSQGGLGIGLGLVKGLVQLHGGSVEAYSAGPGMGSEFVVRLPVLPHTIPERDGPTQSSLRRDDQPLPRRRVLVVDDNVDAANSLAKLLARLYGQEVRVAHDGAQALEAAEHFLPEVVLLDIGLPGMDGHEVARRLRERPATGQALIVALTGWGLESDRQRSAQSGFDRHLVKPVDPEMLRTLLTETSHNGSGPS
jgi:signal transduction histidine kinase/CheY-like chemotaxis protein